MHTMFLMFFQVQFFLAYSLRESKLWQEIFKLIDKQSLINGLEPVGAMLDASADVGRLECLVHANRIKPVKCGEVLFLAAFKIIVLKIRCLMFMTTVSAHLRFKDVRFAYPFRPDVQVL